MGGGYTVSVAVVDDDQQAANALAERLRASVVSVSSSALFRPGKGRDAGNDIAPRQDPVCFEVSVFTDTQSSESALADCAYDIVLMDIHLGDEETGIDVVQRLFSSGFDTQIIYVTGYPQFHTQVYATEHLSFLTKPVSDDDLHAALAKAVQIIDSRRSRPIRVYSGTNMYAIEPREIRYIESTRRVLHIHAIGVVDTYATLSQFCRLLPHQFLQCHKSCVFNMDFFKVFTGDRIILLTGESIPVSQRRRAYTRERLSAYFRGI
ncbi:LytTR family DNA-binding domain-containing protein [Bifidobacterium sp. UTCIF-36]|uniref:LytR/AlgR family response regulator transcription factor n=1 Tax=Bifidobacterium sp. UTCIF-36 TaxID=1465258 RepID=UPI00112A5E92|nr:LytR domain-containing response regulator [Bifidobacterium sp. UTCIF-36]